MKDASTQADDPTETPLQPGLTAFLAAIALGLDDSRALLAGLEDALLTHSDGPPLARLQDIDRIGQRLGDLQSLTESLAAGCAGMSAPLTPADLARRVRLAEIRRIIPGLPAAPWPASPVSDDPVLF
ncbi:hypothetical protein [Pseudogemmobacter bohemicus]|uniref:hypothetical protein n=1 Tax=Pseudogemmobacter bohemicus TaxID=2250708 RepID=UPI000DD3D758|nr:hypothetical protein [Pseudogemmobacter bohemicus]